MRTETENSCRNSPGLTHVQKPTQASTAGPRTPHTRQHAGNCGRNCSPGEAGLRDGIWVLGLYGWEYRPQSHSRYPIQGRSAEPRPTPPAWRLQPPGSQVPCVRPAALPYAPKPLAHHQGQTDPATPRFPPPTTRALLSRSCICCLWAPAGPKCPPFLSLRVTEPQGPHSSNPGAWPWASFLGTAEFQAAHRAVRRNHKAGFPTASGR